MPCSGFIPSQHTTKIVHSRSNQTTSSVGLTVGPHPTGKLSHSKNNNRTNAAEKQDDKVAPEHVVYYQSGSETDLNGTTSAALNVAYEGSETQLPGLLQVEFSMGINVGNPEANISFLIRNQTNLWIGNRALKAKGQGIVVLAMTCVPDIETSSERYGIEKKKVEISGDSLKNVSSCDLVHEPTNNSEYADIVPTDRIPAKYPAQMALAVAAVPRTTTSGILQKMVDKLAAKSLALRKTLPPDPRIAKLFMHEFIARGWNDRRQDWQMPVYPDLTTTLRMASKSPNEIPVWHLDMMD
ncbi:hypothetical protein B0H17DRAFT_1139511 [Mycena rosella]|uniref:Uncharacterized protein n=1 Tax=Mycena rosella TaxID=1033263 RepID=A0AAD7D408_MYCRO|nr:hypothetical protein B0H17DRAFT_1139511 [Mycena rosella]